MKPPNRTSSDEEAITVSGPLQGFFFGIRLGNDERNGHGLSGFAFPDLGILFKCRHRGPLYECQYEGLVALLKFTAENPEIFKNLDLELFTDSAIVNYQMNHGKSVSGRLKKYRDNALSYRKKIRYRISWVPFHENLAIMGLRDMATIISGTDIRIDECQLIDASSPRTGRRDSSE